MITSPADESAANLCVPYAEEAALTPPPDYKQELRDILTDTPSYDPELGLTASQIGSALNELIERIFYLSQS